MAKLSEESIEIKVNIDTEEAVKQLKNLQRVARETVKALKEVESLSKNNDINITNNLQLTNQTDYEKILKELQRNQLPLTRVSY